MFINLTTFIGIPNYENIIRNLPPNCVIGFLEVYKELIHCFIPIFSQELDERRIYDQLPAWCVEIHIDDPQ
jgi:hypothetical protein